MRDITDEQMEADFFTGYEFLQWTQKIYLSEKTNKHLCCHLVVDIVLYTLAIDNALSAIFPVKIAIVDNLV